MLSTLYVKRRMYQLKLELLSLTMMGIKHRIPKRKVLLAGKKKILALGKSIKLDIGLMNQLYQEFANEHNRIRKRTVFKADADAAIYNSIRAKVRSGYYEQETNAITYAYEYKAKNDYVHELASTWTNSPFFLASTHKDPAKDHKDYEGKMYYDEDWERKYDGEEKEAIRAYIRNHKLLSLQYVSGPVGKIYLGTRRNCKHFFKNIPLSDVLHSSRKKLLERYGMYMPHEEPVPAEVLKYRHYYNKVKLMNTLYEIIPNPTLEKDLAHEQSVLKKMQRRI